MSAIWTVSEINLDDDDDDDDDDNAAVSVCFERAITKCLSSC